MHRPWSRPPHLRPSWSPGTGKPQRARAHRGIAQVTERWRAEDGDANALAAFVRENFAGTQAALDATFARFEHNMETVLGHSQEIRLELNEPSELDLGPIAPYDEIFAAWNPTAHVLDDMFDNKLAFVALLNFPLTSLEERTRLGRRLVAPPVGRDAGWPRSSASACRPRPSRPWPTPMRSPARYIAGYNIWMHHLVDARGQRLFPRRQAAALALEPARRAQGQLRGQEGWPREAAHHPARDGAHRGAGDSRHRHRQPGRGLESVHQCGDALVRERCCLPVHRRPLPCPPGRLMRRASPTPATRACSQTSMRSSRWTAYSPGQDTLIASVLR